MSVTKRSPQGSKSPRRASPGFQPGDIIAGFDIPAEERARRLARHERFWEPGFVGEGAYFSINAPLSAPRAEVIPTLEEFLDPEKHYADTIERLEQSVYGGDALPIAQVDFGPGILPAVLGRPYRLGVGTVWFDEHPFDDPSAIEHLIFNRAEPIYQSYLEATRLLTVRSEDRYTIALADIGSTLDVLAALYQREALLIDFVLEPERVAKLLSLVGDWWREGEAENLRLLRQTETYISTWIPLINRRDWYAQLSELSALVSPTAFEDLSLPVLAREAELFEQIVFNVDGDSYARHLPSVLKIPKLHAIDWAPTRKYVAPDVSYKVYTEPNVLEVARSIQEHVKLIVNGIPPWQVEEVLEHISADGVFFIVNCDTPKEAEEFLELSHRWTKP